MRWKYIIGFIRSNVGNETSFYFDLTLGFRPRGLQSCNVMVLDINFVYSLNTATIVEDLKMNIICFFSIKINVLKCLAD